MAVSGFPWVPSLSSAGRRLRAGSKVPPSQFSHYDARREAAQCQARPALEHRVGVIYLGPLHHEQKTGNIRKRAGPGGPGGPKEQLCQAT